MDIRTDHPNTGRIIAVRDQYVVFRPTDSMYELYLKTDGSYDGPVGEPVQGIIRVRARRIWTVCGGGNFIIPIAGPTGVVQGRVRLASDRALLVHAAGPIVVDLPDEDNAIDLSRGAIGVGTMVNVTCVPGATFQYLRQTVAG